MSGSFSAASNIGTMLGGQRLATLGVRDTLLVAWFSTWERVMQTAMEVVMEMVMEMVDI